MAVSRHYGEKVRNRRDVTAHLLHPSVLEPGPRSLLGETAMFSTTVVMWSRRRNALHGQGDSAPLGTQRRSPTPPLAPPWSS